MNFISLRKHTPEPEADEDLEEFEEEPEEQQPARPTKPVGWAGALFLGVCGPARWLTARFGPGTAWIVHVVAPWAVGYYGGWVAFGIIAGYLLAVLLFIPREHLERAATAIERLGERRHQPRAEDAPKAAEPEPEEPPADDPEAVYAATLEWIRGQIADRQGVHLRDILANAQAHGMFEGLDVTTLRAHLERYGIPTRDRVRVRGLGVTVGVYRADLPAPSRPSPEGAHQDPPDSALHVA